MITSLGGSAATVLGVLLAGGAMVLFAACAIVISIVARRLDTDCGAVLSAGVNLPVGIVMVAIQLSASGPLAPPTATGIMAFLLAGIFSTYLGRWLFFKSIETMGPTRASSFQTSSPLMTALIGWLLLGERFGPLGLVGMAMGVIGLALMSRGAVTQEPASAAPTMQPKRGAQPGLQRGILVLGLGSSLAYAVSHVLRAAAVREWSEPLAGAALGAGAGVLVLLLVTRKRLSAMGKRIAQSRSSALLYCVVGSFQFTAQALMIASMKYIPASFAALITMCTPLVVLPLSYFVLRNQEAISIRAVVGMLVTIAGVALLTWHGFSQ